jgi:hypothetical protein
MRVIARVPAPVWLGGLVALSTLLRYWAASQVPTPWILPDETLYGELGRSLYHSGSFEILGHPVRFYSLVYPALAGLPLSLGDTALGYSLLKPLQALVMSLAAVPTFLWARMLMSRGWALAAAALALTVPGLAYSGLVMTEVAFYPIAALALWLLARSLVRPNLANQSLAVGGIVLASATRLQGVALAPAFVTAIVLLAFIERNPSLLLGFWPALGGLAVAGAGWAAWRLSGGGPASDLLAGYQAAGRTNYSVSDAILYARWHLADVLLMTGVVPACALALLLVQSLAGREHTRTARAFVAVATAATVWIVAEVGVFASRHVGRLAERDLLGLVPMLFVGLCVWLARGAPRPRIATTVVGAGALGVVLALPVGKLVSLAAIPDAFTLIPLYRLQVRSPSVDLQVVVDLVAAAGVAAFVAWPRRFAWALAGAIGLAYAAVSVSAGRVVASQATFTKKNTLGYFPDWIDRATPRPVTFLYSGEALFSSVWENLFWNRRVERVYSLNPARVFGLELNQQPPVEPRPTGALVVAASGRPAIAEDVVAPAEVHFDGEQITYAYGPALILWRTDPPFRLSTWRKEDLRPDRTLSRLRFLVYACRGGTLRLKAFSPVAQQVTVTTGGRKATVAMGTGTRWRPTIHVRAENRSGRAECIVEIVPQVDLALQDSYFVRAGS